MAVQNVVVIGPIPADELEELTEAAERDGFGVILIEDGFCDCDEPDDEFVLVDVTELMVVAFLVQEFERFVREDAEIALQNAAAENEGWPPASDD